MEDFEILRSGKDQYTGTPVVVAEDTDRLCPVVLIEDGKITSRYSSVATAIADFEDITGDCY